MSEVAASTPEPRPSMSFAGRLIGVFFSPGETFDDIARKPDFLFPLIVLIVASVAVTETLLAKIGMAKIITTAIEQSGRPVPPAEQLATAIKIQTIVAHVAAVVATPIVLLVVAAIGLLIVNVFFGGKISFLSAFSITCYSYVVTLLASVMGLAMILFGDQENFNVNAFIPSNLGFFLNPRETSKPLMSLASSFDIFTLWPMLLLGVGFSAASMGKVKARSIFLVYFGIWLLYVLGKMGLAALF
jgi:hypothetical protein